jgi:hypothetical protein
MVLRLRNTMALRLSGVTPSGVACVAGYYFEKCVFYA